MSTKAVEVLSNPKVGVTVAAVTTGTGTSSWFEWIPADIGLLAAFIGVILSAVLIVVHVGRFVLEYKQAQIKMKIMNRQLEAKEKD